MVPFGSPVGNEQIQLKYSLERDSPHYSNSFAKLRLYILLLFQIVEGMKFVKNALRQIDKYVTYL